MDILMKELATLSEQYNKAKEKFFDYSDKIISSFNLSADQKKLVAFGIVKTSDSDLQNYVDILNSDKNLIKYNRQFLKIKFQGIIKILQYAMDCEENISGYDLKKLLTHPLKYLNEINILFEGLAGAHHVHMIGGKIMIEMPAREYVIKNRRLSQYVDFWNKKLNEFGKE